MDLNELVELSTSKAHQIAFLKDLTDSLDRFTKPIIAAVVGFAVSLPSISFLLVLICVTIAGRWF
jgi:enoyl-CoA hydratase/carnithine racemase